jgi:hypothetical protein
MSDRPIDRLMVAAASDLFSAKGAAFMSNYPGRDAALLRPRSVIHLANRCARSAQRAVPTMESAPPSV